jgi:hypothetical protein
MIVAPTCKEVASMNKISRLLSGILRKENLPLKGQVPVEDTKVLRPAGAPNCSGSWQSIEAISLGLIHRETF